LSVTSLGCQPKAKIIAAKPGPFEDEESRRAKLTGALDVCVEEVDAASAG